MAPAITHFLVGAGLLLLLVSPIAYRYDLDHTLTPLLVPTGGIWGLAPDFHHITPVYEPKLYAFHNSRWADLFGLHYLLDTPTVRGLYHESVFGSILFFSIAVGLYTLVVRSRSRKLHPVATTVIATAYGGAPLALLAFHSQRYDQLAAVVDGTSLLAGVLVLAAVSLVAGVVLAVVHERAILDRLLPIFDRQTPLVPALAATPLAVGLWLGAAIAVPLWFRTVHDATASLPWFDLTILLWLVVFTITFSAVYALLRTPGFDTQQFADPLGGW